jgi:hypothetical protein
LYQPAAGHELLGERQGNSRERRRHDDRIERRPSRQASGAVPDDHARVLDAASRELRARRLGHRRPPLDAPHLNTSLASTAI